MSWAIALIAIIVVLPTPKSPYAEIRLKIESPQSVEDLRTRTEHLVNAMESQEKIFLNIRELLNVLLISGGILTLANLSALYYITHDKKNNLKDV